MKRLRLVELDAKRSTLSNEHVRKPSFLKLLEAIKRYWNLNVGTFTSWMCSDECDFQMRRGDLIKLCPLVGWMVRRMLACY